MCQRGSLERIGKKRLKYLDYLILIASPSHMQSWSAMNLKLTALLPVCDLDDGDGDGDHDNV